MSMLLFVLHKLWSIIDDSGAVVSSVVSSHPALLSFPMLAGNVDRAHVKIKGAANPYNPHWEVDFEARVGVQMTHNLQGRRQLRYLWKQQAGLCPVCHQKITRLTGWHNHHVVWRSHGGRDTADNRVLLHPTCHRQVHSQTLDGAQPRSTPSVQKA